MAPLAQPDAIAHADWGSAAAKRIVATAQLGPGGVYLAHMAQPVGDGGSLLERMGVGGTPTRTLLGFDFPIGLPRAYADRAEIENFSAWLRGLDVDAPFFSVADDLSEVSIDRPFLPRNLTEKSPGIKSRFRAALGLSASESLRLCERAHAERGPASETLLDPRSEGRRQGDPRRLARCDQARTPGFEPSVRDLAV